MPVDEGEVQCPGEEDEHVKHFVSLDDTGPQNRSLGGEYDGADDEEERSQEERAECIALDRAGYCSDA